MRNVRWESSRTKSGISRATRESQSGEIISFSIPGLNCHLVGLDRPAPTVANLSVVRYVVDGSLFDRDVSHRAEEA
jgi:hypothetical protein